MLKNLDKTEIEKNLRIKNFLKEPNIYLFPTIDSTNLFLKRLSTDESSKDLGIKEPQNKLDKMIASIDVCCAEQQTNGRGRLGRHWFSPYGENIYLSCRFKVICNNQNLEGLSLVIALAILAALDENKFLLTDIKIKWPNDLLWQDKKLCGILIEIIKKNYLEVIIGVGLNVNMDKSIGGLKDWCSLRTITGTFWDRNPLIAYLIYYIDLNLNYFFQSGFRWFKDDWQKVDYLYGKKIIARTPQGTIEGFAHGVDVNGNLCILDKENFCHILPFAETSIVHF